ncbi:MAG: hypothetical protein GYB64_13355 [Chloroflexi bacterium]|nr:hypothetical protein [Chloroflexota bacterium]
MNRRAGLLAAAVLGIVAAVVMVTFALAWIYSSALLGAPCVGPLDGLDTRGYPAEAVSFPSREGHTLRGWYSVGSEHPEIVIIVVPGGAGNTWAALNDAAIFAEAGFSTLIYEHRTCADPDLHMTTGYREAEDLLGAVDYLRDRDGVDHIGVSGFSVGGTAALLAAPEEPAIEAVIAMGGFASLAHDIRDPQRDLSVPDRIFREAVASVLSLRLGTPVRHVAPVTTVDEIAPRPLLLVYGEYEMHSGGRLYEAAGPGSDLWMVPGATHGAYPVVAPEEYSERLSSFMQDAFAVND